MNENLMKLIAFTVLCISVTTCAIFTPSEVVVQGYDFRGSLMECEEFYGEDCFVTVYYREDDRLSFDLMVEGDDILMCVRDPTIMQLYR